jgi:hypothetical protein
MSLEHALNESTQKQLREQRIIGNEEVAIKIGDIFVAENVINKTRRKIEVGLNLTESTNKQTLLKG